MLSKIYEKISIYEDRKYRMMNMILHNLNNRIFDAYTLEYFDITATN